jgi:hypothetical protein
MQVHQKLKILFYRKTKKKNARGYIPIYCRVTIDGMYDEISTGCRVLYEEWSDEAKEVLQVNPNHKMLNKKLRQMQTDLERHFDLVVAKYGLAMPEKVFVSYRKPVNGQQQKLEKTQNLCLGLDLDNLIKDFIKYDYQLERVQNDPVNQELKLEKLVAEKETLILA